VQIKLTRIGGSSLGLCQPVGELGGKVPMRICNSGRPRIPSSAITQTVPITLTVKLGLIKYPLKALNRLYSTQMAREIKIDIISDTVSTPSVQVVNL